MKFSIEVFIERVDYRRYTDSYASEAWSARLKQVGHLKERVRTEHYELPDGRLVQRVRIVPEVHLPKALQTLLAERGHLLWYDEVTILDVATRSSEVKVESPAGELVSFEGIARCYEERGGLRMTFDGQVQVKLIGLGRVAERFIVAELKRRHHEVRELLQAFLDEAVVEPDLAHGATTIP